MVPLIIPLIHPDLILYNGESIMFYQLIRAQMYFEIRGSFQDNAYLGTRKITNQISKKINPML
jgi:hypothetical protein